MVVIKASIEFIEKELTPASDEIILVTDPKGVVFISNRKDWLYHALGKLSQEEKKKIAASFQFGRGPWSWFGLKITEEKYVSDSSENRYLMHRLGLNNYPGWDVIHLYNLKAISKIVSDPLIKITGPIVLALCVLVGLAVSLLYRKASDEIFKRKTFEKALQKNEERYRSIYHNTPAMLHSVDTQVV
ncbi:MAG: hypothetical protein SRB2_03358 [Desulfobacteraceae bacterium Eth-SRB2]|nr:MAG: hypothetical protein SRB2_03358 [Desulfobacteraceae bacterium Eth-SRB2]